MMKNDIQREKLTEMGKELVKKDEEIRQLQEENAHLQKQIQELREPDLIPHWLHSRDGG